MDILSDFLDECCMISKEQSVEGAELYRQYKEWARSSGERIWPKKTLTKILKEKDFQSKTGHAGKRTWQGISIDYEKCPLPEGYSAPF